MSTPLLEVEDLTTTFSTDNGDLTAVDGVDFVVDEGRPSVSSGSRAPERPSRPSRSHGSSRSRRAASRERSGSRVAT